MSDGLFVVTSSRARPVDLAPGQAAFYDHHGVRTVTGSRLGSDCACTPGTTCRHNNACPRLPGRAIQQASSP